MAAAEHSPGEEPSRVDMLEAELERKDRELARVVNRYEHVIETRARLRRETRETETFVWNGATLVDQQSKDSGALDRLRSFLLG